MITTTLLLSFIVMMLVIVGMSIGVINGRKAISGSCGGLGGGGCVSCTGKSRCQNKSKAAKAEN